MKTPTGQPNLHHRPCGCGCAVAALLIISGVCASAASITFVGVEPGTGPAYAPQNWSSPAAPKSFDLGGSEVYGTSGFYQIRPTLASSPTNVSEAAAVGNDLGIAAGTNPTLYSMPVVLSAITGGAGTYVNFGGYPTFLGPDGTTIYRQGSLSVPVGDGPFDTPSGTNSGYFGAAFNFTMGMSATYRVGITVDTAADGNYAPDYVSVFNGSTGTVYSAQLARNGTVDMAIFEIDAAAGDSFTAAVWQLAGTQSVAPFGLITFDVSQYKFDVGAGLSQTNTVSLGGAPAAVLKTGAGTLVLASSNSSAGGVLVSGGTLVMASGSVIGGNITNNATLAFDGAHGGIANAVSGTGSLVKTGVGTATFYASNSYTGATVVNAGQLMLGGAGAIPTSSAVQIATGASVNLTGFFAPTNIDRTIGGLTGAGLLFGSGGTVTVDKASGSDTFSGEIQGGQGLVKAGAGTLVLAGTNTYSGTTDVDAGVLGLHANSSSPQVSVDPGAALGFDATLSVTTSGAVTFGPGAGVSVSGSPTGPSVTLLTASGGISGTPSLTTPVPGYALVVNPNSLVLQASGSTFSGWLGTNAPTPQLLASYAFGAVSPTNAVNSSNIPTYSVTSNQFVLNYFVRTGDTNLIVWAQAVTDLSVGPWTTNGVSNSVIGTNTVDGVTLQQRRASVPITGPKKFLRLWITE